MSGKARTSAWGRGPMKFTTLTSSYVGRISAPQPAAPQSAGTFVMAEPPRSQRVVRRSRERR